METTQHQMLAQLATITGHKYQLLAYEQVIDFKVTDESVALTVRVHRVTETNRELRFTHTGMKMLAWRLIDNTWQQVLFPTGAGMRGSLIMWDESAAPIVHLKYGEARTPAEVTAKREYERMCYRPGTDTQPLDNYDRVLAGCTPAKMERYW